MNHVFVVTWTGAPTSRDPLDFDMAQNLFASRMLYATPIETSADGSLSSRLLDSFEVFDGGRALRLVVKTALRFEGGREIQPADVAFSIARMALVRPKFPVIESLVGLDAWRALASPLETWPQGIVVNGREIVLRFTRAEAKPLFRLSLEPFAVIPRECIDVRTNKLVCARPPESGPYRLAEGALRNERLLFTLRQPVSDLHGPEQIEFRYTPVSDGLKILEDRQANGGGGVVVFASDLDFTDDEIRNLRSNYEFLPTAKSWHGFFLLNPDTDLFADRKFRQRFAHRIRERFKELSLSEHPVEASVFTELTPGYQTYESLSNVLSSAPDVVETFNDKKRELTWARRNAGHPGFSQAMRVACKDLSIDCREVDAGGKSSSQLWDEGISLLASSTGFWPLDPLGDLQMLFTPNMHKILQDVASNQLLQKAIREARSASTREALDSHLHDINLLLLRDAIYNVYTHHQYFYVGTGGEASRLRKAPLGMTVPYPWQVFVDRTK
jgi:hypothetical protein